MNIQYKLTQSLSNMMVEQKKVPNNYPTQPSFRHHTFNQPQAQTAKMQRILILGSSGSGKSTLARQLGNSLNLPIVHLDQHFWHSGWVETPMKQWQPIVNSLIQQERWILDGNYRRTLDARLQAADTAVFLDLPAWLCMYRAIKRRIQYINQPRPDIAQGCQERLFDPKFPYFLSHIWQYSKRARPDVQTKLQNLAPEKRVIWLQSTAQVKAFLQNPLQPQFVKRPI